MSIKPYPKRKAVICNGNKGVYIVDRQVICCLCDQCSAEAKSRGLEELELSPTDFERHSGVQSGQNLFVLSLHSILPETTTGLIFPYIADVL